jgi:two-component system CheB/CheR fusion protein
MKPRKPERRNPSSRTTPTKRAPSPAAIDSRAPSPPFPIVGIGASAGGLEALESFLTGVPLKSGMAFVVVQHLDPTHKGIMAELLQRVTPMPVVQVKDRTRVDPDSVYIIPPNKDMSILHGTLHLLDPLAPRGLRLPIDFFFRTLADDQQEHSIGVILSGMGSDGTLGLRAIKEKAGAVFVQEPSSAKFDGMPRSAIEAGLADVIAPVEALPGKISAYLRHMPLVTAPRRISPEKAQSALEKVVILLRSKTGHDFSLYKKSTIYRRIERRMGLHQVDRITDYVRFLQGNPQEVELLFRELLIGVTSFFRDLEAWKQLKREVLPALLTDREPGRALRAWVPACASGEEAYSLAILFRETQGEIPTAQGTTLQIFATDLDQDAIAKAREGFYPPNIAADVSPERLDRFFVKTDGGFRVAPFIRQMVVFAPQNLVMDPPFTKLDLLSCRNLLIYLSPELQKSLLPLLHYSLNPGGFLFLGNAETVGDFTHLFEPLAGKPRLYRRLDSALGMEPVNFPAVTPPARRGPVEPPPAGGENLQSLADRLLLQTFSPAAALTNVKGDILYTSGRTGRYLEPAAGKANWNLFAMAREGLRHEVANAFARALRQETPATVTGALVESDGGPLSVDVTVQFLRPPSPLQGMVIVVFRDVPAPPPVKRTRKQPRRAAELERDLENARQEMQRIRQEMRSSQEELRSANEELQSTNEELQSTNEELTTSKEELQSMNEELHTVNQELRTRLDELTRATSDMDNLLNSTDIATLFLDQNLNVRRFTTRTGKLTRLIPADVGRPVTDIASALLYPGLADDAREVLRTLVRLEREIPLADGEWFNARVLPYRTLDSVIDGVVITFMDITAAKKLETELRATDGRPPEDEP